MKPETRKAALRAAARTALVVSLGAASACGGATPTAAVGNRDVGAAAAPLTCDAYLDGLATTPVADLAKDDPLHGQPGVYVEAFADRTARASERTQQCCAEALAPPAGGGEHRWPCCNALPSDAQPMACTPWGPPCPPTMA